MANHPLRMERELRGWSQSKVAEAVDTSVRSIIRWEQGKVLPQPFYRERLCALFGKDARALGIQPDTEGLTSLPTFAATAYDIEDPLLATRISLPVPAHTIIQRPRLTDLLTRGSQKRLTLVSAPAGSGKTTLIAEWLKTTTCAHAWISLDEEEDNPERFWLYVLTALNTCQPDLYAPLIEALHAEPIDAWYAFVKNILNTLLKSQRTITLVLDDYHRISNPLTHDTVAYFLEHLPPHAHLIIATRKDPPWSLSRLRAQDAIQEIRTDQLNGTEQEVNAFLAQTMQITLSPSLITEITRRTEGWFVGIQLLALSLRQGTDVTTMLDLLHGSQRTIFDYLIEEVFSHQPPAIQEFLLQTSLLERLNASSCDAIRNTAGSQEILDTLEKANLFIVALDQQRQWYRYHQLFAQALRARLARASDEQTIRTLYKRASIWHAQQHALHEMICYAIKAQEWEMVAEGIASIPFKLTWSGQHILQQRWIEDLPAAILRQHPYLCLRYAHLLLWQAKTGECELWLNEAQTTLAAQKQHPGTDSKAAHLQLTGQILSTRALMVVMRGDGAQASALCQEAENYFTASDYALRAQNAFYQAQAYYLCDQTEQAIHILSAATKLTALADDEALKNVITGHLILHLSLQGRLRQAWDTAEHISVSDDALLFASLSWPCIYQADIQREWNELDTAVSMAKRAIERGQASHKLILLPHWYAILAHCLYSQGDLRAMEQVLQQAEQLNDQLHNPTHLGSYIVAERIRLWLAQGEREKATCWAEGYQKQQADASLMARNMQDIAFIRVLIANGALQEGLQHIEQTLQRARAAQRTAHVIELLVQKTLTHLLTHEEDAATASLSEALALAQPERYIRIFVDEGPVLAAHLRKLKQQHNQHESYIDMLLACYEQG